MICELTERGLHFVSLALLCHHMLSLSIHKPSMLFWGEHIATMAVVTDIHGFFYIAVCLSSLSSFPVEMALPHSNKSPWQPGNPWTEKNLTPLLSLSLALSMSLTHTWMHTWAHSRLHTHTHACTHTLSLSPRDNLANQYTGVYWYDISYHKHMLPCIIVRIKLLCT